MKATSYLTATEFLRKAQAHLEENEAANTLMIGLCLQKHPERIERQPYFATVEDAKGLAACRYNSSGIPTVVRISAYWHKDVTQIKPACWKL